MSSYPPPPPHSVPPPSYGPGFGGPVPGADPRDARRFYQDQARAQARSQRDAVRAQRDAYKAQRALYRQGLRAQRRTSAVGPLLLVTFGVLALLVSTGRLSLLAVSEWFGRWWPLAILLAGVLLLLEWSLDERRVRHAAATTGADGQPAPMPVRRGLGSGTVFLLVLLVLCGLSAQGFRDTVQHFHITDDDHIGAFHTDLDELFGEKYQRQQELEQTFAPGTSLLIDNPHGAVTISGSRGDDRIHITVNKQVYGSSASLADAKAQQLSPQVMQNGSILSVTLPSLSGAVSDLAVTLPEGAPVTVNADHGDLHLSGLRAAVNLTANRGDVELNGIAAPVTVYFGDRRSSLQAHNIGGDLLLKGRADDLSITDVSGGVSLEGEFFGDTHLAHLHGPLLFQTDRTRFALARLDGEVDISPDSALSGSDILGPTELRTRSRNISLERLAGAVDISNTNGSVDLTDVLPFGNVQIDNRNGAVNVTVPERVGITVDALAQGGSVDDSLSLAKTMSHDNSQVQGQVGDGANHLYLRTTHADIDIRQQLVTSPPMQPNPPVAVPATVPPNAPTAPVAPTPPTRSAAVHKNKGLTIAAPKPQDF